jgi:hypothetical protein
MGVTDDRDCAKLFVMHTETGSPDVLYSINTAMINLL